MASAGVKNLGGLCEITTDAPEWCLYFDRPTPEYSTPHRGDGRREHKQNAPASEHNELDKMARRLTDSKTSNPAHR